MARRMTPRPHVPAHDLRHVKTPGRHRRPLGKAHLSEFPVQVGRAGESPLGASQAARDELVKRWEAFNADDKATCIPLAMAGGTPTYTELLTCLDLRRDARLLRESEGRGAHVQDSSR